MASPYINTTDKSITQPFTEAASNVSNETSASPAAAHAPLSLTLPEVVTLVWLAVAGVCLTYLVILYVSLRRKLSRNAARPSKKLFDLFNEAKTEMGIKANVKLVCQYGYGTPSLMFPKTILMHAEALIAMNEEQTLFALRHELMHFKHGDHIVSILLSLLNAVYWFNPFVWTAFSQVRKDMETACDGAVVKYLSAAARSGYASLILSLSAKPAHRQLILEMSRSGARKAAEQRVKGIFMKGESKMSTKLITILLAAALLFTCFTTACQPVTETPFTADGGNNTLKEMIASSALSPAVSSLAEEAQAPETYKDSYTNEKGDVTVRIDAEVELPSVDALSAVRVNLCGFTQENVDRLAEYFLKGTPVFTEDMSVQTKEEIQQQMAYTRGQQQFEQLEKQYREAPEQRKRTPATTKLNESQYGTDLWIFAELGKDEAAEFCVSNYKEDYYNFSFRNDGKGSYESVTYEAEKQSESPRGMEMTREEAEDAVMECLSSLGIDDMQIEGVKTATFYSDWNKMHNENYEATAKQCYAFSLVRMVGGVPLTDISGSCQLETDDPNVPVSPQPDFICAHDPESLDIYVDDTGIVRVEWKNPSEEAKMLSEHVKLMPFDDIVQRAKENMFNKNYTAYGSTAEIKITSMRLGMMRIALKDKPGEYLIVPVWDFIGDQKYSFDGHEDFEPFEQSFVTINAIDGSMIRRDWGY